MGLVVEFLACFLLVAQKLFICVVQLLFKSKVCLVFNVWVARLLDIPEVVDCSSSDNIVGADGTFGTNFKS